MHAYTLTDRCTFVHTLPKRHLLPSTKCYKRNVMKPLNGRHDIRHTITLPVYNGEQSFFTYRSLSNIFNDIIQSVPSNLKESLLQQN